MRAGHHEFEFRASFSDLDEGLYILHQSIDRLRRATGRRADDRPVLLFETALGEIGSNVLTHGRPAGTATPIDYALRLDEGTVVGSLSDSGSPAHEHLSREMPGHDSEAGGGLGEGSLVLYEAGLHAGGECHPLRP